MSVDINIVIIGNDQAKVTAVLNRLADRAAKPAGA